MCRLLVEQYPHRLARFDAAADDRDELGLDKLLGLTLAFALRGDERGERPRCASLAAHRPVGVDIFGVVHTPERFVGGADITLT